MASRVDITPTFKSNRNPDGESGTDSGKDGPKTEFIKRSGAHLLRCLSSLVFLLNDDSTFAEEMDQGFPVFFSVKQSEEHK